MKRIVLSKQEMKKVSGGNRPVAVGDDDCPVGQMLCPTLSGENQCVTPAVIPGPQGGPVCP